jgi:hypothetical protein
MRTDRGWRRFYATGWLVSAGITLAAFRMGELHIRDVRQAASRIVRETLTNVTRPASLLQAGPRRDGGFRVWAELPLRASS